MRRTKQLLTIGMLAGALAGPALADGRKPGSALVFPVQRYMSSADAGPFMTVVTVTNTNTNVQDVLGLVEAGTTNVHYQYVNVVGYGSNVKDCVITDRVELLTPADTLTVMSNCHNGLGETQGYLVVSAQNPLLFDVEWSFNHLVGSELVVNHDGGVYSINALPFSSPQPERTSTDLDGDGLDFDGIEYEAIPDRLIMDGAILLTAPNLALINLTGGTAFTAHAALDVWNDNEFPLSASIQFRCWTEQRLIDLSLVFNEIYLANNTPNDPGEFDMNCMGLTMETAWFRVRGVVANSVAQTLLDPALLGAVTTGRSGMTGYGRLLWESEATQTNGDFLKFGVLVDPED